MAKQSFVLDPNAQSYTDDQIVGKVNAATAAITRVDAIDGAALGGVDSDDISEGASNKYDTGAPPADLDALADGSTYKKMSTTEQSKLSGIDEGATDDQTGAEVRDLIVGLSDTARQIVLTDPTTGQFPVIAIHRAADGKLSVDYDDVAV